MKPAPVENCRVLELRCGDGGNLVPMAFGVPGSEFVGIDLAALPIARGSAMAAALGLENVSFQPVCRINSWKSATTTWLPNGVVYVSYNTFPGCHLRNMVREMMLFHTRQFSEPAQRVDQGLELIKFLAESKTEPDLYHAILRQESERLTQRGEASLYHDELAGINLPLHFFQFVEHAARHGLQ